MATLFELDCALMAGASYISTRKPLNQFPVPDGWSELLVERAAKPSGFEATCFTKGNDLVISFAGTYLDVIPGTTNGSWLGLAVDLVADVALATGNICDQLRQAADYYLEIKASAPAGTKITLTGHSLGGGLASLIAVMFGETAITFDQAPFLSSALTVVTRDRVGNVIEEHSVAQDLRNYLASRATPEMLTKLDAYISANDPRNTAPNPADTLASRSGLVSTIRVDGEFLSVFPVSNLVSTIGTPADVLQHGPTDVAGGTFTPKPCSPPSCKATGLQVLTPAPTSQNPLVKSPTSSSTC